MLKQVIRAGLVLGVVGGASLAHAAPDWCKGVGDERVDFNLERALKGGDDAVWAIHDLVGAICQPDNQAQAKAGELEAQRKAWSQKLDMNDADWADAAAWAAAGQSERYPNTTLRADLDKRPWSSLDPLDQHLLLQYDIGKHYDANYMADAFGAKLSEAGRLAYVAKFCLGSNAKEVQWAMCQPDLDAFDYKKLVAELRADKKHSGYQRFFVRLVAADLLPKLKKEKAPEIKAARDKDPAYAKMFELAAAARKQWDGLWKSEASLLDLALRLDDARVSNSRKALQGCEDDTWKAWKSSVGAIPAKQFGAVPVDEGKVHFTSGLLAVIANDPKGYLAATALYACGATAEAPDALIRNLGGVLERWPGHRGPRTSAHSAILNAGLELDDRSARIDYPDVDRQWFGQSGSSNGGGDGTIASVKAQGDKVRLEFAAKMETSNTCLQSKETNRITQIRADGSIVRELLCLKWGPHTVDRRSDPQTVKARYAGDLKAGMSVYTIEDAVIAGWPKGGKAPSVVAGVPVK